MWSDPHSHDDSGRMHLVLCQENDFNVFDGERNLGRIYRVTDEPTSHWFWGVSFELIQRRSYGYALSLDEAMAEFKAEYSAWRTHAAAPGRALPVGELPALQAR